MDTLEELMVGLSASSLPAAVEVAAVAEQIKGFGHVKARNLEAALPLWEARLQAFRDTARGGQREAA
jgi:indolepyruvate ferredoxin oxidoreductase